MFLPESVATHGREDVEPQWERISVQWEPWCRKKRKRTTQVIKPPLFAIKQPCLPCKFSVAKKVISRGNHGVLSSKKTSCRIMGVVPQPCSEWEVERVLHAAAKAPMQGSCSYSASWRHICVVHAALGVLLVLVPAAQAQEVVALGLFLTRPV